jgi:type I restriction enzyme S subunit
MTSAAKVERDGDSIPLHWRTAKLSEIASGFISGGTPSTKRSELWDGNIPWITSASIGMEDLLVKDGQRFISRQGLLESASNVIPKGNLLIATRVGIGKAAINALDIAISQDLTGVILNHESVFPEFIAYQFKTNRLKSFLEERSRGTTIKGISRFDLQSVPICIPPLPEQRAIARVLRAVQEVMQALRRELELERERKAALMHHLFRYGTRGEPTKQTEIGEIPQSWEVTQVREAFTSQLGKMLSPQAKHGLNMKPYLRNANVQWGHIDLSEVLEMHFEEKELLRFRLQYGDILVCEGGEVGRTAIWKDELPECYFQKAIHRLRPRDNQISSEFFLYHMERAFRYDNIYGITGTETTIAHLPQDKLLIMKIPKPPQEEQKAIVRILEACDSQITALEQELALYQELFRALLEELMSGRLSVQPLLEQEPA